MCPIPLSMTWKISELLYIRPIRASLEPPFKTGVYVKNSNMITLIQMDLTEAEPRNNQQKLGEKTVENSESQGTYLLTHPDS